MQAFTFRAHSIAATLVLALALSACGGGGGGATASSVTVSGFVVEGPVSGATVELEAVDTHGARSSIAQTVSGTDGSYAFTTAPASIPLLISVHVLPPSCVR